MAEQRYNKQQPPSGSIGDWILPLVFLFVIPPVGMLLLVLKLFGGSSSAKKAAQSRSSQAQNTPSGSRTSTAEFASAPKSKKKKAAAPMDPLTASAQRGKKLTTIGAVLTILFGFCTMIEAVDSLWVLPDIIWFLEKVLPLACFAIGGGCTWLAGRRLKKKVRRYRQYLAMIGQNQTISISSLASATGRSSHTVREDLQDMLDDGLFPTGFLDYGGDQLVLSPEGLKQQPKEAPKQKTVTVEDAENAVLTEIRAVNDSIAHEGLSAQIDRIGIITAKIFDYQKSHPEKSPQLHSFLSYYLPTTLKILRAYAQLESQGIEGENITAAKQRIEGMMDKVVEGFEKQLDQLFQNDALDITSDVKVLEQMLSKDGLSSGDGIRLSI